MKIQFLYLCLHVSYSESIRFVLLLLIRKSLTSLRKHIERVTDRLPKYHDHEDMMSPPPQSPSLQHKDTTLESIVQFQVLLLEIFSIAWILILFWCCWGKWEQQPVIYFSRVERLKVYCYESLLSFKEIWLWMDGWKCGYWRTVSTSLSFYFLNQKNVCLIFCAVVSK